MSMPMPDYERLQELLLQTHYHANDATLVSKACDEIGDLRARLNRQSEQLAAALKEKNDWVQRHEFRIQEISGLQRERDALIGQLAGLRLNQQTLTEELARLKPPEPKFRVGQVFYWPSSGNFSKVVDRVFENGKWKYRSRHEWNWENELRALTDEEK